MTIRALKIERDTKRAEIKPLARKARDGEDLTPEERSRFDALEDAIDALNGKIDLAKRAAEAFAEEPGEPIKSPAVHTRSFRIFPGIESRADFKGEIWRTPSGEAVPVLSKEDRFADFVPREPESEIGLGSYVRALAFGPRNDPERRALTSANIGTTGAQIPTPISAEIIDLARAQATVTAANARVTPMSSATLKIGRVTGDPAFGFRAEGAAIVESDPTMDHVALAAKSAAVLIKVNRELLEDGQNIDAQITGQLARAAAVAMDTAALVGSGASNQPLGLRGQSGIQAVSMGTNGAALTNWTKVLDAVQALEAANAGSINAMVMAPRTARVINGFVDTTNQPLQPPPRLASIPRLVSTAVPIDETQGSASNASSIFLGDFTQVIFGLRTDLTVTLLQERFADNGQFAFIAWMRFDVALARPAALARIAGIIP
jgi:HK97 family phage major capsid protein